MGREEDIREKGEINRKAHVERARKRKTEGNEREGKEEKESLDFRG